jgi:hypothetical protein
MLANKQIVQSHIGKEFATFLIEFLPFEEDPLSMLISARLVLQEGLISEVEKLSLWKKAKSKNTLYVAFLESCPNHMPEEQPEHALFKEAQVALADLLSKKNPYAVILNKLLSVQGQTFLKAAESAFKRVPNYDIAGALLESIRHYLYVNVPEAGQSAQQHESALALNGEPQTDIDDLNQLIEAIFSEHKSSSCSAELRAIRTALPELDSQLRALLFLARSSQTLLAPTIASSTAVGSLMRKKLKPVFEPVLMNLKLLQG